ncbi:MAG: small basic protein [Candidatus Omnitrophota bacterium]
MTQHPSLKSSDNDKKQRSVLKRFERLRHLHEKGKWNDGDSIFGMQKIKIVKFKIKKEKAAAEETPAEGAEATPAAATGAGAGAEKQKPTKEAPKKK